MRIFLTGATGFIGSRILPELLAAGHEVLGLARSEDGARALAEAGVRVHRGSLEDLASMRSGAEEADAIIHTAFDHDFSRFVENCEKDRKVISAFGEVLKGSSRPLLITSGTGIGIPDEGGIGLESVVNFNHPNPRIASEQAGQVLLEQGINVSVMRLPQVHDTSRQGLITSWIAIARTQGKVAFVGEGANRWPAAHVGDVARLYALAITRSEPGARYHAVAEEGVPARAIAQVLADGLDLPLVSLSRHEMQDYFGWLAMLASEDMPASSARTREITGWVPTGPDLLTDLKAMNYAANPL
ncbi:SDR family oxidoreductase [Novosphingobium profundi]|nr:SDR family oxidoreductase [Novosphingobium profundi]MBT0670498.1 SDR family oxidoreductase [Novosphingobium profundi]